jgi:hypothetical protein
MMWRPLLHVLTVIAGVGFLVSAGKEPTFLISFHEEGEAIEGPKKVKPYPVNGETKYFRTMPLFTQIDIKSYWPFPAEDGSHGAVFWLDTTGQHVLERVGVANRGQYVAAVVNRVPVDLLLVDGPVPDGRIVIWKGLPPQLFQLIDKEKKIKRVTGGSPGLASRRPRPSDTGSGTNPVAGIPLPEGAVFGDVDPAVLDSATADMDGSAPKKKSRWNPFRNFRKGEPEPAASRPPTPRSAPSRPAPSKPAPPPPEPSLPGEAPFSSDTSAEQADVVPLDEPGTGR